MKRIHRPDQTTIYHCLSRTAHGQLWLDPQGKAVLCKLACYIDLNPVRASMVDDPALYAWSGYGAARVGSRTQHQHLGSILNEGCNQSDERSRYLACN